MSANLVRSVALLACACALASAHAQLYKWTDANGKVHYSDTVPPEANNSARKEMGTDGIVRGQVDRALTPEERRAAAAKAEEEKKARSIIEERERRDRALASTYTSLADFDRVRDRALAVIDSEIAALTVQLAALNKRRAESTKPSEAAGKKGQAQQSGQELNALDADIANAAEFERRKIRDRADMAKHYATERARLADLMAAQAATPNAVNSPTAPSGAARSRAK